MRLHLHGVPLNGISIGEALISFVYAFYMGPGFYSFLRHPYIFEPNMSSSRLFQERKGNIFLSAVVYWSKSPPQTIPLLYAGPHDYPPYPDVPEKAPWNHTQYRRQVLKPFYFRFSLISRRFIVPQKSVGNGLKIPAEAA